MAIGPLEYITTKESIGTSCIFNNYSHRKVYPGPKLNKPLDDLVLCAILLCMVICHWDSTYWINIRGAVPTNLKDLIDKLEQVKVSKAVDREKDRLMQTKVQKLTYLAIRITPRVLPYTLSALEA